MHAVTAGWDSSFVAKRGFLVCIGISALPCFGPWPLHGSGAPGAAAGGQLMSRDYEIPSWDGDPGTFQTFEVACQWYEKTLKDTERRGAAARVWSRLTGPAKSVVKHLSPDEFDTTGGLAKLLAVLRSSPLQTLPIPDSFSKLERWHQLRRKENESIPELIVREDDLFRELQTSLRRSRARVGKEADAFASPPTRLASTPASPSSAQAAGTKVDEKEAAEGATSMAADAGAEPGEHDLAASGVGFFEDELRGFRLLKAAGLTNDQRMQVLTLTSNEVAFEKVRQALRALFDDNEPGHRGARHRNLWYAEDGDEEEAYWQSGAEAGWGWYDNGWEEEQAYWSEWPWDESWDPYLEETAEGATDEVDGEDPDDEQEAAMVQEQEASALAAEAARTLQEARLAVQKVRAARGYYPLGGKGGKKGPSNSSGKGAKSGAKPGSFKSRGKWGSSKASGKGSGCLICGRAGHFFRDCPQRFEKGGGKPSKGYGKKAGMYSEPVFHMYFGITAAAGEDALETAAAHPLEPGPEKLLEDPILRKDTALEADSFDEQHVLYHQVFPEDPILLKDAAVEAAALDESLALDPELFVDGTIHRMPTDVDTLSRDCGKIVVSRDGADKAEEPREEPLLETSPLETPTEQALVMSLDTAFVMMASGDPGFVLDTGATENAVGVKTLQAIISKTGLKHKVTQEDRPVFRFGDGLSLRACSKVTLFGTALGEVDFYVLDGDHRPQTRNAENTPALLGSRFLRKARGTISYERLCLWFRDFGNTLWATELIQTQSGHLMIPAAGSLLDLSSYRARAEEEHSVRLPLSAASLMDVLSTPGALEELKRTQGPSVKTRVRPESVRLCSREPSGEAEPDSSVAHDCSDLLFFDCLPDSPATIEMPFLGAQFPIGAIQDRVIRPQLCQRLRDLAPVNDPRQAGYPCYGKHSPSGSRQNQYGKWTTCQMCGLRTSYEIKHGYGGHGKDRSGGATYAVVREAMEELETEFPTGAVNEKICNGKMREVQGRRMGNNEKIVLDTKMEKKSGAEPPRASTMPPTPPTTTSRTSGATPKRMAAPPRHPTPPTCEARRASKIKEKATSSTTPQQLVPASEDGQAEYQDLVDRSELHEAWLTIQDQENKLARMKQRLKEALGQEAAEEDEAEKSSQMSWAK